MNRKEEHGYATQAVLYFHFTLMSLCSSNVTDCLLLSFSQKELF